MMFEINFVNHSVLSPIDVSQSCKWDCLRSTMLEIFRVVQSDSFSEEKKKGRIKKERSNVSKPKF